MSSPAYPLDKARIADCFGSAADSYDAAAVLQRQTGQALLDNLHEVAPHAFNDQARCGDIGCGTGFMLEQLARAGIAESQLFGIDLAPRMLASARRRLPAAHWLCGDAEQLPLASQRLELCVSNLAVQWLARLDGFLAEAKRVLRPDGWLAFTTLGDDTFSEFTRLCRAAGLDSPVNRFTDRSTLRDAIIRSGFAVRSCQRRDFRYYYPDALTLLRNLKTLGAHYHPRQATPQRMPLKHLEALAAQSFPNGVPARYDTWLIILQHVN
ncbi:methyltransferase domain-containing protein [Carnimonas bestiolae]|uniref:methyltransferase domain-containing protein n=1 Tax=Carnimonas bestiolae TaxID=3402172 RepID=UPI003EDC6DC4